MLNVVVRVDRLLRGTKPQEYAARAPRDIMADAAVAVVFAMIYGGAMGSWGLVSTAAGGEHWLSSLYSALKAPVLLAATFGLSLPVLFVLYTLAELRSEFSRVVAILVEMQSVLAIVLGGLAPFTLLWYLSSPGYVPGVMFNGLMFAVATIAAPALLRGRYGLLVSGNARHRQLLRFWMILYVFIGIQMGWILRPFIGSPGSDVAFFRGEDLDNAYVTVAGMIWRVLSSQ